MNPGAKFLRLAFWGGALAVMLGAFGAHGLRGRVTPEMLAIFETGVRYHMYHVLVLALLASRACGVDWPKCRTAACWFWVGGTVIFSGTLYLLVLSGAKWWGAITPIGGVLLVAGWVAAALTAPSRLVIAEK